MANFTCGLLPEAKEDLAALWLASPNPGEIVRADRVLFERLAGDPFRFGTMISEGLYRSIEPPLVWYYEIDPEARHVTVASVREVR